MLLHIFIDNFVHIQINMQGFLMVSGAIQAIR